MAARCMLISKAKRAQTHARARANTPTHPPTHARTCANTLKRAHALAHSHTHTYTEIRKAFCSSTATIVLRTRLSVTSYVYCLSCLY